MKIDLHMHTYYSDGLASPTQLAAMAAKAGIEAMAVSDHDTTSGVAEGIAAATAQGLICLPALEISSYENVEVHILGYNIDIASAAFVKGLNYVKAERDTRNFAIIKKLRARGYNIDFDQLKRESRDSVGRVIITRKLLELGYFADFEAAFSLMSEGACCYEPHFELPTKYAIDLAHSGGGLAVVAHPGLIRLDNSEKENFVKKLKKEGLDGIETEYRKHTINTTKLWQGFADKYEMFQTVGGDNHTLGLENFFPRNASERTLEILRIKS